MPSQSQTPCSVWSGTEQHLYALLLLRHRPLFLFPFQLERLLFRQRRLALKIPFQFDRLLQRPLRKWYLITRTSHPVAST